MTGMVVGAVCDSRLWQMESPPQHHAIKACSLSPGQTGKSDAPVQLRRRCEGARRGLGYGGRAGRGVASFRLTGLPPVSSPLCTHVVRRVRSGTFKGASAPRTSSQVSGLYAFESFA